jgi:hypothetical protein
MAGTVNTWRIDAGDSTNGPVGFVIEGIKAATAEEALQLVRDGLPQDIEESVCLADDGCGNAIMANLRIYLNPESLTLDNIEPDDEGTEGQDRESYSDTQDRDNYTVKD